MNKRLFTLILGIILAAHMLVFPVLAAEDLVSDAQTVAEELPNEEKAEDPGNKAEDPGRETDVGNDSGTASGNEIVDESVFSEETGEGAGTEDAIEEEPATEGASEEANDVEEKEIGEDPSEDPPAVLPEETPDDPADTSEPSIPAADPVPHEAPGNAGSAAPKYARPVIKSITTDGTSITLEWDNEEGVLFRIYRWNIIPYVIGTSTTGTYVDTDVTPGRSYTYYISTSSAEYRYPYSQRVSIRVRLPIGDIDEGHKLGEDLAWNPEKGEEGRSSLVISGSGDMPDFSSPSETPWHDSAGEIKHISIDDGVTYVGDHTFSDMENLEEVTIPSSVREYGHEVFRGSTNLEVFNHDNAADGDQLQIAVQYLMGIYSGDKYEPEVNIRKGAGGEGSDGMPELIRDRDYTVTYSNTTEVGDGTIEITFIGDYADAGSVVIPFIVASELRKDEKIKAITDIELLPASSAYNGSAQHPDVIVRSGRWVLKEGVDYSLTYPEMVSTGVYTVIARGIGAYSGQVEAVYTILDQEQSEDPQPPVDPSQGQGTESGQGSGSQKGKQDPGSRSGHMVPAESRIPDAVEDISQETEEESSEVNEEKDETEERATEAAEIPVKLPSIFGGSSGGGLFGNGGLSSGDSLGAGSGEPVIFFVGAVGVVATICIGAYFWFFHRFLHGI